MLYGVICQFLKHINMSWLNVGAYVRHLAADKHILNLLKSLGILFLNTKKSGNLSILTQE